MKRLFTSYVCVSVVAVVLCLGCKNKQQNANEPQNLPVTDITDTTKIAQAATPDLFDENIEADKGEEVWTMFGGTYFFFADGESVVLEFPLIGEGGAPKFMYGDYSEEALVDEQTGKIVVKDSTGRVVFKGYVYDGGNTLRGILNGKPFEAMGSGD